MDGKSKTIMVIRVLLNAALFTTACLGCPQTSEPPCSCRMIGYHSSIITCSNTENEMELAKSLHAMRSSKIPIKSVEIFDVHLNFLPSDLFAGLKVPRLFIAGSSMVALSDEDTAFVGLEDSLEILVIQEVLLMRGWLFSQLRDLRVLRELTTVKAGLMAIGEDVKEIAHLNITQLQFMQGSISYIYDTAFSTFHNLEILSLKGNEIETMKRSMFPDPALKLRNILLSHNKLQFIPTDLFSNMPVLQAIALSNNKLLTVDETAFKPVWGQLKDIDLLDNPLRCDCRMKWLLQTTLPRNTWIQCFEPKALQGRNLKELKEKDLWC